MRSLYWAERQITGQLLYRLVYADELSVPARTVEWVAYLYAVRLSVVWSTRSLELEPTERD